MMDKEDSGEEDMWLREVPGTKTGLGCGTVPSRVVAYRTLHL